MVLKSDSNMILEAETLIVQGREVLKEFRRFNLIKLCYIIKDNYGKYKSNTIL